LLFDASHALGARVSDRPVGSLGIAETFSFTPSKIVVGGEGGAVVTADSRLAAELVAARNYGRSAHGDWTGRGVSARLPEISALLARLSLAARQAEIERRARLAATYRESLGGIPGIRFQAALHDTAPVYRDISIRVSAEEFGLSRDGLRVALDLDGVQTGAYFHPAVPDLPLARRFLPLASSPNPGDFPRARQVAAEVVNLPVGPSVTIEDAIVIGQLVAQVHEHSRRLRVRFQTTSAPRIARDFT
jgi:dTDP-4-amino-4,6-dideoxygalactose transaminase